MSFLDSPVFDQAARKWEEPPDDPTPDFEAYEDADEAQFHLHNEHGHCYCAKCAQFREGLSEQSTHPAI